MRSSLIFRFIALLVTIASFPVYAGRVSVGNGPADPLDDLPRQKTILPSPISAEGPKRSYVKESASDEQTHHGKHSVKNECSCKGCFSGGCKGDQRYKVNSDADFFSPNVFITAYFPSAGWKRGSASILSTNCLGMAGHLLYRDGEYASEVLVVFGMQQYIKCGCCFACSTVDDTAKAIATNPVFAIHPDFLKDPDSPYDLAIMSFKRPSRDDFAAAGVDFSPFSLLEAQYEDVQVVSNGMDFVYGDTEGFTIGEKYGVLSMGEYSSEALRGEDIIITGYPAYVGRACKPLYNMYASEGKAVYVREGRILHNADTSDGVSGGSMRLRSTGELVGIHTGDYNAQYNQGAWFDRSSMDFLRKHLYAFDREWAVTKLATPIEL